MIAPPSVLDLRIEARGERSHHIWLPLFLLWPLGLALGVLALVLTIVADVVLLLLGRRYHYYTFLVAGAFAAFAQTRGMVIRINDGKTTVDLTVL